VVKATYRCGAGHEVSITYRGLEVEPWDTVACDQCPKMAELVGPAFYKKSKEGTRGVKFRLTSITENGATHEIEVSHPDFRALATTSGEEEYELHTAAWNALIKALNLVVEFHNYLTRKTNTPG
jgi:hypothetical protein